MIDTLERSRFAETPRDVMTPHGGRLVRCLVGPEEAGQVRASADSLSKIVLEPRILSDLDLIAIGALSPLQGFMTRREAQSVLDEMRLPSGVVFPLPVVLPVDPSVAPSLRPGDEAALVDSTGVLHAVIEIQDVGRIDLAAVAQKAFGTISLAHPGVAVTLAQSPWIAGGPVRVLARPVKHPFPVRDLEPLGTRAAFRERGWRTIVAFQTRNPIHRAHEYLQKCALEVVEGLLVHPLVGETKSDDIPAPIRMRCYETLLELYYPKDRVLLSVLPAAMRYAGPREAVFHAILRRNYGCTHFIVGRDHAGVGNFYGTYEAQELLRSFTPAEIGITPLFFENSFYCRRCGGMASQRTCPHPEEMHLNLSGSRVREMLRGGDMPPPEFTRPEVARVLMEMFVDPSAGI